MIHRKLKQALRNILWDISVNWFTVVQKETLKPLASVISKSSGSLMLFKIAPNEPFVEKYFVAVFHGDEDVVYKSQAVYSICEKEVCLVIDITLTKGGPESIAELY